MNIIPISDNPYVGPRTFTRQEGDRFFGREREARDLFSLVVSERLVLFYAQSGAGKSSLINTRLMPQLQEAGFAVLSVGRVSGELPPGVSEVDNIFAFNLMLNLDQGESDPHHFTHVSLTDFLARLTSDDGEHYYYYEAEDEAEIYAEVPSVLIIDQFEEIITSHSARWPEREGFFRQLDEAMAANSLLWVVLSLREDYVAALDPYASLLTDKLRARFYMQRMGYEAALEVVKKPAALAGRPFAPGVAESLVDNLRQIRVEDQLISTVELSTSTPQANSGDQRSVVTSQRLGQFVEPVQLQVVCYQLWENLKGRSRGEITAQDLPKPGDVDTALAEFYEQAIQKTSQQTGVTEPELRRWFEQKLITVAGMGRVVQQEEDHTAGLPNSVVKSFADQLLLQTKTRAGKTWYELIHPRFIEPILRANRVWQAQQAQQLAEITYQDVQELGNVDTALAQFYEQAIAKVLPETGESEIELRNWFERQLITEAGTRGTVYQGPEKTGGLANHTVELLANQFLLRADIRAGGVWYELVHDRFIEPILRANKEWRLKQTALVQAALAWAEIGRNEANLYRGQQLEAALASVNEQQLEPLVAEFLIVSKKFNQDLEEKEALRQRELEQAQALAEAERRRAEEQARATKLFRRLAIALAVVFLGAVGAAILAWNQAQIARTRQAEAEVAQQTAAAEADARATAQIQADMGRKEAEAAQTIAQARRVEAETAQATALAARNEAERSALIARSGQLAAQAQAAMSENYPQRSLLLAVEAAEVTRQTDNVPILPALDVLWQTLTNTGGRGLGEHGDTVTAVAISPDNRWVFTAGGETLQGWNLANLDATPVVLPVQEAPIAAIAISPAPPEAGPGNQWLVAAGGAIVHMWNLANLDADPIILPSHRDLIRAIAISPDNRWLVTGSNDRTARVWDLTNLERAPMILSQETPIVAIAISPDSRRFVTSGSFDTIARVWDLTNLDTAPIPLHVGENPIDAIAISPDNQWLIAGSDGIYLWNLATLNPDSTPLILPSQGFIKTITISFDSHWFVTGNQDGTIQVWDLTDRDTRKMTPLNGHNGAITAMIISPNNRWLVTGSTDRTVRMWDLANLDAADPLILRGHDGTITAIAISPTPSEDGTSSQWLVTGSADTTARLWDLTAPSPAIAAPIVLSGQAGVFNPITKIAVSGAPSESGTDNHWLVTASEDATLGLWDLTATDASTSKKPAAKPPIPSGHEGLITAMAISPDNHWLATASDDTTTRLWNLRNASDLTVTSIILRGHQQPIRAIAISPDNRWLASGSDDTTVRLWDLQNIPTSTITPLVFSGHEGSVTAIAFSSASSEDGLGNSWLATASGDRTVHLWNLRNVSDSAVTPIVLPGPNSGLVGLAFSPDQHWLAAGDDGGVVYLWNLRRVTDPAITPLSLSGHSAQITALAISPNSRWLATAGGDRTARLWDLTTANPATTSIVLRGHEKNILALAISPDSHWLATGSFDGVVRLWDLTAADPAITAIALRGHSAGILAMTISLDNHWLITGSADGTTRLWTLRPDELVSLACRTAGRNFTAAEWAQYFAEQDYRKTCPNLPTHHSVTENK